MDLIWGVIELGLTIGPDLLARTGTTCPHCNKAVEGSPPSLSKPKAPDDEFAGRDAGQAARDNLSAVLCGVAVAAMLGHMILHWCQSSVRREDPIPRATTPSELTPPPVASVPHRLILDSPSVA